MQEFDKGLAVSDAALKGMLLKDYKDWIKTMMDGIAALANQCSRYRAASRLREHASRANESFERRKANIEKWREESEALIETRTFTRAKDSARLRTKVNFAYLARLLRNKDWYLVSLLCTKGYQQGTWLTRNCCSLL